MLVAIPLTDDERAAVDDGQEALDKLLERLSDIPTLAGPTPHQLVGNGSFAGAFRVGPHGKAQSAQGEEAE
jgi:hypothetical protein